jgi:hypothetical protein
MASLERANRSSRQASFAARASARAALRRASWARCPMAPATTTRPAATIIGSSPSATGRAAASVTTTAAPTTTRAEAQIRAGVIRSIDGAGRRGPGALRPAGGGPADGATGRRRAPASGGWSSWRIFTGFFGGAGRTCREPVAGGVPGSGARGPAPTGGAQAQRGRRLWSVQRRRRTGISLRRGAGPFDPSNRRRAARRNPAFEAAPMGGASARRRPEGVALPCHRIRRACASRRMAVRCTPGVSAGIAAPWPRPTAPPQQVPPRPRGPAAATVRSSPAPVLTRAAGRTADSAAPPHDQRGHGLRRHDLRGSSRCSSARAGSGR